MNDQTDSDRLVRLETLQGVTTEHIQELYRKHEALTLEVVQGRREIITSLEDLKAYFHTHMEKRDKQFAELASSKFVSKLDMVEYVGGLTAEKVDASTKKTRLEIGIVVTITLTILAIVSDVVAPFGAAVIESISK
ncbi:MAG: hypothetical protein KAJ03_07960 [Gammaproteobacteria bacterium]|nr:hypothetical protein [Gammaproteobacteria bacterium]